MTTPFPEVTWEVWEAFLQLQERRCAKKRRNLLRALVEFFVYANEHRVHAVPALLEDYQDSFQGRSENAQLVSYWALRNWFQFLYRRGLLLSPVHERLYRLPPSRRDPRRALTYPQVVQLMRLPLLSDPLGLRDRALLETAYGSALRPSELKRLQLADVQLAEGQLVLRTPKNRVERVVPLTTAAKFFLTRYLQFARPQWTSSQTKGALWLHPSGQPLNIDSFTRKRLRLVYRAPEILGIAFTLHHLRHSCATHLLQNGAGIMAVKVLLGHARLESSTHYTYWATLELAQILRRCHPRGV